MPKINQLSHKLSKKLQQRTLSKSLRVLNSKTHGVDFYSNDYLGLANHVKLQDESQQYLVKLQIHQNGSTGSRLISGNSQLFDQLEIDLAKIHQSESSLIFNSGYDVNLGLLSSVPQRSDLVLYDKLSHASIRDGLQLSHAKSIAFKHNDLESLESKLIKYSNQDNCDIYIVTESLFSMDGDQPDLKGLAKLAQKYTARLIIDEAHALGVFGYGLVQKLDLQESIFARVVTFGKALGCHGAVILGSKELISYLVNFARSFIYTTALPPMALAHIKCAYKYLHKDGDPHLLRNIQYFKMKLNDFNLQHLFIESDSAIQSCIISGNERVKFMAAKLREQSFIIKAILSPTVPKGQERLRFCIHNFNTKDEISSVLKQLKNLIK